MTQQDKDEVFLKAFTQFVEQAEKHQKVLETLVSEIAQFMREHAANIPVITCHINTSDSAAKLALGQRGQRRAG